MRVPIIRAAFALPGELVVDNFAGGGGASTGIEAAIGRPVDIAINHSPVAIAMHKANHPGTKHYCEDVWSVDPREACGGRPVGLAWFSPDCTHFSRAKGKTPVSKGIRGLAWVVIRWAKTVRPRVILLENVEEFQTWGPLAGDRPDPEKMGQTFRRWLGTLTGLGYRVEFKTLTAADYGAPTTRKRLFLIARRDDSPIVWPDATHGRGLSHEWRPASEIIDWSLQCPSIFDRARPLAEATCRRIAEGIRRYVVECARPFIVSLTHTKASTGYVYDSDDPLRTITTAKGGEFALAVPTLIQQGYGERSGQAPRVPGLDKPLGTVVAGGSKHALVAAFLSRHFTGVVGRDLGSPVPTVTARDHHSLTVAFLTKFYGECRAGAPVTEPLPTVTGGGGPLHTVTSRARFGLVTVAGEQYAISDIGMRMLQPAELFAAQGFPDDYEIAPVGPKGKPLTKCEQIEMAGNSVCPPVARALVTEQVCGPRKVA